MYPSFYISILFMGYQSILLRIHRMYPSLYVSILLHIHRMYPSLYASNLLRIHRMFPYTAAESEGLANGLLNTLYEAYVNDPFMGIPVVDHPFMGICQ